jgi:IclR family KDG regulon transcriptional repressor
MRLPLLAGAGGKALLSQLSNEEFDRILSANPLRAFTAKTCTDKKKFKREILKIREDGIAFDDEEYITGIVAFAVPLRVYRHDLQAAIWAVGLKQQVSSDTLPAISNFFKKIGAEINRRFSRATISENTCE